MMSFCSNGCCGASQAAMDLLELEELPCTHPNPPKWEEEE